MARHLPALLLLLAAGAPGAPGAAAAAGEEPAKLKEQILDATFLEATRLKAAKELVKADPEMMGAALLEMGEKQKNPAQVPFLAAYVAGEEVRHLRYMATYAAWMCAPEKAAAAFLEKASAEDEKQAIRSIEAAGHVAAVQRDREAWTALLKIARGERVMPGIEAARAVNRGMDRRIQGELVDAALEAADNHVRKHLAWAVMDLQGNERGALKAFEGLRGRPGTAGKNAAECAAILMDKQAGPHEWKAAALKEAGNWWRTGRPKGNACVPGMKDEAVQAKIRGWFAEAAKFSPAWSHYIQAVCHEIDYRTAKGPEIYDVKKKVLALDASEVIRCETPWQGAYVAARGTGIGFSALVGEPSSGHRGWEPAYVDLHAFMKTTKQSAPKLEEFVDQAMAKKPWP
jgi:hypothetical protein